MGLTGFVRPLEDLMTLPDFIYPPSRRTRTATPTRPPLALEVHLLWEDLVLDTQHHAPTGGSIAIGDAMGWRWSCLGIDMGEVPPALRPVAGTLAPILGGVDQRPEPHLFVPSDLLEGSSREVLATWESEGPVVTVPPGWRALVSVDGQAWEACGQKTISLGSDAFLRLQRGPMTLAIRRVTRAVGLAGRPEVLPDRTFGATLGVVGMLGLMLGLGIWSQPRPESPEVIEVPERIMSLVYQAPEPPPPEKTIEAVAAPAERTRGDEGKLGSRQGKKARTKAARGSEKDRQAVAQSGIFQAWGDPTLASLSSGGLSDGLRDSLGTLTGPRGVRLGTGGLGDRGRGPGGGGNADLTAIQGRCTGTMSRCGPSPSGVIDGEGKRPGTGVPSVEDAILVGNIDRSAIDEVIKRHMPSIRYCYQQYLQRDPNLGGKVVVRFTIAGDGSVARADVKRSSMDQQEVESCIVGRFLRMEFPPPRGGGIAIVSYPFLFSPG